MNSSDHADLVRQKLTGVNRRTTLKWLGAALGYSSLHGKVLAGTFKSTAKGYGTDPDLNHPVAPWDRILTTAELQSIAVLADLILPADPDSPSTSAAPSSLGIHEFVDEWVSAPYPDQLADRAVIRAGLAWLDTQSDSRFGAVFVAAPPNRQIDLLTEVAKPQSSQALFFQRLRAIVVGAYFSSDLGMKDLGYSGNVALTAFPAPTQQIQDIIERECRALGI